MKRTGKYYNSRKYPKTPHGKLLWSLSASAVCICLFVIIWLTNPEAVEELLNQGTEQNQTEETASEKNLLVHFLDVGQGACVLIQCDGEAMLIDGGPDAKGTAVQRYLREQNTEKLKYVIGTHYDADHIGGLDVVIYKFDCENVILPDYEKNTKAYLDLMEVISEKEKAGNAKPVIRPVPGDVYLLGGGYFTIIAPNDSDYEDENDYSIGILFTYGEDKYIFTGDATANSEKEMLESGEDLDADVYYVAHHGSSLSSSEEFLKAVSPEYAVISCGVNDYGHPHNVLLERLEKFGCKVYRTDICGTIVMKSDGTGKAPKIIHGEAEN